MKNRSAPLAHPAMRKKQFFVFTSKNIAIGKLLNVKFFALLRKERKIEKRKEASVRYFYRRLFILKSNKKTDRL
ncbi:MAG: hypothetical protein HPZ86_10525 [Clostridia bacterium]|nr:hypothetical protein [Clostridia bacterium]